MNTREIEIIQSLAKRYYEFADSEENVKRKGLWRNHNSLKYTRPLVRVMTFGGEEVPEVGCICEDPLIRPIESFFRKELYKISLNDDAVFKPWYTMRAIFSTPKTDNEWWGPPLSVVRPEKKGGAFIFDPPIKSEDDFGKLIKPRCIINEAQTSEKYNLICDILGDIIPVVVDRAPNGTMAHSDISTDLAYLLGLEQMMYMMVDNPDFVKKIVSFMCESLLEVQSNAEEKGDLSLAVQWNQSITYACELPEPSINAPPARRKELWAYCAAQESTGISPSMWEEFIFTYQRPIFCQYGLLSYGCCEDLTRLIPILKRDLSNLRRIAVTPWANFRSCAEQIGSDYVLSWRPSPSDMVSFGFHPDRVKNTVREAFKIAAENKNIIDITLKDVETVSGNMEAVPGFVRCVREVIEEGCWR